MARRFQSRSRLPQGQRRKTEWIGGVSVAFNESSLAAQTAVIISAIDTRTVTVGAQAPFTITRTLGYLNVSPTAVTAAQFAHGAYGICVVNGEAFDAGVASIITPFSESFDDRWFQFMYWSSMTNFNDVGGAGGTINAQGAQMNFDSRAQRKVNFGDVVVAVLENGAITDGIDFLSNFRMLVKLH